MNGEILRLLNIELNQIQAITVRQEGNRESNVDVGKKMFVRLKKGTKLIKDKNEEESKVSAETKRQEDEQELSIIDFLLYFFQSYETRIVNMQNPINRNTLTQLLNSFDKSQDEKLNIELQKQISQAVIEVTAQITEKMKKTRIELEALMKEFNKKIMEGSFLKAKMIERQIAQVLNEIKKHYLKELLFIGIMQIENPVQRRKRINYLVTCDLILSFQGQGKEHLQDMTKEFIQSPKQEIDKFLDLQLKKLFPTFNNFFENVELMNLLNHPKEATERLEALIKKENRVILVNNKPKYDSKARKEAVQAKNAIVKLFDYEAKNLTSNFNNLKKSIEILEERLKTIGDKNIDDKKAVLDPLIAEYKRLLNAKNDLNHIQQIVQSIEKNHILNNDPVFKQIPKRLSLLLNNMKNELEAFESRFPIENRIRKLTRALSRLHSPKTRSELETASSTHPAILHHYQVTTHLFNKKENKRGLKEKSPKSSPEKP